MVVDMKGSVKIALIIVGVIVILGLIFAAVYFNKLQTQDYKLNEKQSIYQTAGLVYHQEILGDVRVCHCIDHLHRCGVRFQ